MRRALLSAALLCALPLRAGAQELPVDLNILDADKLDPGLPMDTDEQLAQQLNNPVANLISVPIQNNFDYGLGQNDRGFRYTMVAQPVLPFKLSNDWNLITRTVIPYAHIERVFPNHESGLGDTLQSVWLSPARPTDWGLTWGVGPAILYPTATNSFTGARQWAVGPTGVAVVTRGPWIGLLLANQIWTLGDTPQGRARINQTFVQAALAYTTETRTTFFMSTETTYDYTAQPSRSSSASINCCASEECRSSSADSLATTPTHRRGGPKWGFQLRVTFVFPK